MPIAGMISAAGWAALAFGFGSAVGEVLDPRAIIHAVPSIVLVALDVIILVGRHKGLAQPEA